MAFDSCVLIETNRDHFTFPLFLICVGDVTNCYDTRRLKATIIKCSLNDNYTKIETKTHLVVYLSNIATSPGVYQVIIFKREYDLI